MERYDTHLEGAVCPPETSIRTALARINDSPLHIQFVVDATGRLLGSVTDGDVRRALLTGVAIDDPVSACMFQTPRVGRVGQDDINRATLHKVDGPSPVLPVLDADDVLIGLLVRQPDQGGVQTALVMAGGYGSRLGSLTKDTPKPLLEVGGKPILEHILSRLEVAGVADVYISIHYKGEAIRRFIAERPNRAQIHFLAEKRKLGTAGCLSLLPEDLLGPILVLNGDVMTRTDFDAMDAFHHRFANDVTIGAAIYEHQVPYGVIDIDSQGAVLGLQEKPRHRHFVSGGIYYLNKSVLSLVPRDKEIDMPEVINLDKSIGMKV